MVQCPFLSTTEEKVDCFKKCVFHEEVEANEQCPFKNLKGITDKKVKKLYDYYLCDYDEIYSVDEKKPILSKVDYL